MRRGLLVVLLLVGCSDPPAPTATSERFTYRVVDERGAVTEQVTDLQGPYRARTTTSGRGGFLWDEVGTYVVAPDGTTTQTEYAAPGFPGPASNLDISLPVALRQQLVANLGPGTAAGKSCTRWLSQLPLDGAPFSPAITSGRTESCVDDTGLLLSETWQLNGKVVRTRSYVSTTEGPPSLYDGKRPSPMPTSLSSVVVSRSTPDQLARLLDIPVPAAPTGLEPDRATAVLDVNASRQGFTREAGVFTWVAGERLVVLRVERDLEDGGTRVVRGEGVDLGSLGQGYLEPVLAGLRVTVESGRLRLICTADVPEAELLRWLRSVQV